MLLRAPSVASWIHLAAFVGAIAVPLGCEEKKSSSSRSADAGAVANRGPAVDPNIAAAVKNVAKAAAAPTGAPTVGGENQPPPNGVFPPGEADKAHPAGAPPKLTLGAPGGSPRLATSGLSLTPGKTRQVMTTVSVRTGPRAALPTLDIQVSLTADEPKKEKDEEAAAAPAPLGVIGKLTDVKLSAQQPGRLPPGLEKEVQKVAGSRLSYRVPATGGLLGMQVEPSEGIDGGLVRVVGSLAELWPALHAPYPSEPVGSGGYWMVASRENYVGLDVVAYRMFRVDRIEGDQVTLGVTTKRFVAGGKVDFPGLPDHTVDQFSGEGQGEVVVKSGVGIVRAQFKDTLLGNLAPAEDPSRRITIQLEASASVIVASE